MLRTIPPNKHMIKPITSKTFIVRYSHKAEKTVRAVTCTTPYIAATIPVSIVFKEIENSNFETQSKKLPPSPYKNISMSNSTNGK